MASYEIIGTSALQAVPETMETLYTRFINYTDVKETTLRNYTAYIRRFLDWLMDEGITQPSREDIKAYKQHLNGQEYSAGTRQQYLRAVKHFSTGQAARDFIRISGTASRRPKLRPTTPKKKLFPWMI